MNRESFAFGAPLLGVTLAAVVIVFGVYQGGLNAITLLGGLIGLLSVVVLFLSVSAAS